MINQVKLSELQRKYRTMDLGYDYVGLRVVDTKYSDYDSKVGDILAESHVWEDGNSSEETLDGTCAISAKDKFKNPRETSGYSGDRILVIGGNEAEYGQDECEIVIKNAIVIEIVNF